MNRLNNYILYIRRSQDSEDRQVCSIDDQEKEMIKVAERHHIHIIETITESRSAKEPGREGFNKMIQLIEAGKAQGILTWALSRLSRNAIDTGTIQWLLQKGVIKEIRTASRSYLPGDNVLLMAVELGMSNQYILDLKRDIKRGLRQKAERGWNPSSTLPPGYIHTPPNIRTPDNEITPHPEYFDIVNNLWKLLLSEKYSIAQMHPMAKELGLRNKYGRPYTRANIYNMFNNEFYCGYFYWDIDGNGNKQRILGKHKRMISERDFYKVKLLFSKYTRPEEIDTHPSLIFKGLISCGECGCKFTPDRKVQVRCANASCRYRFSCKHMGACPKCNLSVSKMPPKSIKSHTYYRCTKKRGTCSQKAIKYEEIEIQFRSILSEISLSSKYAEWARVVMNDMVNKEDEFDRAVLRAWEKRMHKITSIIDNYDRMFAMGDLGRSQYEKLKGEVIKDLNKCKASKPEESNNSLKEVDNYIDLVTNAEKIYEKASNEEKILLFQKLGSNQKIIDKTLYFSTNPAFERIKNKLDSSQLPNGRIEPKKSVKSVANQGENQNRKANSYLDSSTVDRT